MDRSILEPVREGKKRYWQWGPSGGKGKSFSGGKNRRIKGGEENAGKRGSNSGAGRKSCSL